MVICESQNLPLMVLPTRYIMRMPVYGIARQKFTWDTEHYAQSLSRIYDTEFVPVMDERKGQVYISEDYPDVKVQVWGRGSHS